MNHFINLNFEPYHRYRMSLRFCPVCSNMMTLREGEEGVLQEFCRRCGHTQTLIRDGDEDIVVYERTLVGKVVEPRVNKVVFTDPAVPTTDEVMCPNEDCPSTKGDVPKKVKYIVLNNESLEILYHCDACKKTWKATN